MATYARTIRRGLPRRPGGEPWPPFDPEAYAVDGLTVTTASEPSPSVAEAAAVVPVSAAGIRSTSGHALRRGLPRTKGGEPWPAPGVVPTGAPPREREDTIGGVAVVEPAKPISAASNATALAPAPRTRVSLPVPPTHRTATGAGRRPTGRPANPRRPSTARSLGWIAAVAVLGTFGLLLVFTLAVLGAAWFMGSPTGRDFESSFPGQVPLPEGSPRGFPAWVQWQHFLNVFLIVLIIRSGIHVRAEKRPTAFWTPRWSKDGRGKISLALWFHQSLDVLWLVNGVVFMVLLFTTGHWVRIVPTSWEVLPNALSAGLQYLSLDWPTEHGWVNYNSLQQLMYFMTVFIAAPLAVVTGLRMSRLWPKSATTLNRLYPIEWARAIHFPVMVYFVTFIVVHVALVFATGALRNLNHMYGGTDAVNWTGFWIFFASMIVIVMSWVAARPFLLAPLAGLTGRVST